jgi:hypothetical protein
MVKKGDAGYAAQLAEQAGSHLRRAKQLEAQGQGVNEQGRFINWGVDQDRVAPGSDLESPEAVEGLVLMEAVRADGNEPKSRSYEHQQCQAKNHPMAANPTLPSHQNQTINQQTGILSRSTEP